MPRSPKITAPATPEVRIRCLCATTRRAARLLTQRYEEALRPAGMTVSQFELMNMVRVAGPVDQSSLVQLMESDQTTLSRGIKLLLGLGWVEMARDDLDGRRRSYCVSETGQIALQDATRRWQRVHDRMEARLRLQEVWPVLDRIQDAAR